MNVNDIPAGYRLVPVEPTKKMLDEFVGVLFDTLPPKYRRQETNAYRRMLDAAPSAPIYEGQEMERILLEMKELRKEIWERGRTIDKQQKYIERLQRIIKKLGGSWH